MVDKSTYNKLKKKIKYLCRRNVILLCDDMGLNDYERSLLLTFYDGKTRIQVCMEMCISLNKYTNDMKILFTKINDYYKNTH